MSVIHIAEFDGIYPRVGNTNLPDNAAVEARNVKLHSGEIRPWRAPEPAGKVQQQGVKSILRVDNGVDEPVWFEWTADTDVCYSPVADNEDYRLYYSEDGVCKKTNWSMATEGSGPMPRQWLHMGVPAPKEPLKVKANRVKNDKEQWEKDYPDDPYEEYSADNTENRVYVYTYVAEFGKVTEESAPSSPASVVCDVTGGDVELSGFVDPETDHYNIVAIRIYRAVVGAESQEFLLVDELPLKGHKLASSGISVNEVAWAESLYRDKTAAVALGMPMECMYFNEPPEGLRGLVSMPNGFLAGFVKNQVWFSEPFKPHAWPSTYMLTVDSEIVGLGVYGNTLVVATKSQPYTISGNHPASMSQEKQPMVQPCVSKRSIAYDQYGVLYASAYGLVAIAAGQMDVFTRELMTQDEWREYRPHTMLSAMYNNLYVAAYRKGLGGSMLVFARGDRPALVQYDFVPSAVHVERGTGRFYCLDEESGVIYEIDASPLRRDRYVWTSKEFFNPHWTSFSAMKVDASYQSREDVDAWESLKENIKASNESVWQGLLHRPLQGGVNERQLNSLPVNGSVLEPVPTRQEYRSVTVTVFADGKEVYHKAVSSPDACRLPGVRGFTWQVRFSGTIGVKAFAMATTMQELAQCK